MKYFITLIALFYLANSVFAQANLEVTLIDEDRSTPVPNDTVFVRNPSINYSAFSVTNKLGRAYFRQLPTAGTYSIFTRSVEGMISAEEKDQVLGENTDMTLILIKEPFSLPNTKITSNNNIRINTQNGVVVSELAHRELKLMPNEARDLHRVLLRLPNVSAASGSFPEAPLLSINGASGMSTAYLVEGMDNTDRIYGGPKYPLATSVTQNVYVLTNGYGAEFGNAANGLINTTTRAGTNEHTGEIGILYRPGFLDGPTPFAKRDLLGDLVKEGYSRYQLSYNGGGAFQKDKFFYFVGSEHAYEVKQVRLKSDNLGINSVTDAFGRNNVFTGRVDYVWNSHWRSALMLNWGLYHLEKPAEGVIFPSAASVLDRTSQLYTLKNTFIQGNLAMESNIQFGTMAWNYDRAKLKGERPQVIILDSLGNTAAILGHPGYLFKSDETTFQFQQKLKWYLKNHKIRAGVELTTSIYQRSSGSNPFGNYTVQLNRAQFAALAALNKGAALEYTDLPANTAVTNYQVELRNNPFLGQQTVYSAYVEDVWDMTKRLTLTAGLRYDYDNLSRGNNAQGDYDNIAPRLSANYKLNEKMVIRGAAGIYYDRIPFVIALDAMAKNNNSLDFEKQLLALQQRGELPATASVQDMLFEGNLAASTTEVSYLNAPSARTFAMQRDKAFSNETRVFNPNGYKNPYTYQFSIGFQQQINKTHIFSLDIVHNQGFNLARLRELNSPAANTSGSYRTAAAADLTRPIPIYEDVQNRPFTIVGSDTLRGISRSITMTEMAGRSTYTALSLNYQKERGNDTYAYRLNYTLSALQNDTEDPNFRAIDANNYTSEWAPGLNDRTHAFNFLFYYFPKSQWSATFAANVQSGQPINYITASDWNGDGFSATPRPYFGNATAIINPDRLPGVARNSGRLPWAYTFDMGLQYDFKYTRHTKKPHEYGVLLRLDVLNILNTAKVSGYASNSLWSNQYQTGGVGSFTPKSYDSPRQIQLTALWNW